MTSRRTNLSDDDIAVLRRRARALLLLDAAEQAGVAPLSTDRLHALAFLADVLSPVWRLRALDKVVLKASGGPYYPDLQRECDRLVAMGLLQVSELRYVARPQKGARIEGRYSLDFSSDYLEGILSLLGARSPSDALDPHDAEIHRFLVELAGALALLPGDEIGKAAVADVTYSDAEVDENNLVYLERGKARNRSVETANRFNEFIPKGAQLSQGEKLYLYATYLGQRVSGVGK